MVLSTFSPAWGPVFLPFPAPGKTWTGQMDWNEFLFCMPGFQPAPWENMDWNEFLFWVPGFQTAPGKTWTGVSSCFGCQVFNLPLGKQRLE